MLSLPLHLLQDSNTLPIAISILMLYHTGTNINMVTAQKMSTQPTKKKKDTHNFHVDFPLDLYNEVKEVAKADSRSVRSMVVQLCKECIPAKRDQLKLS